MTEIDRRPVRLPRGVRDYLPEAAARRRHIGKALLGEFDRWGYRRIITPAFEYESVLSRGLGPGAEAQAVRFVEPGTGEVVMLRPDITPQIARLVATRLAGEPGPVRLSYQGAVVRLAQGGQRELFQAGAELAMAPSPAGDVEVIALAAAALAAASVPAFTLDLGEAALPRAALADLPTASLEALRAAIARKDAAEVDRIAHAADLPAPRRLLLCALPSLYGGPEVIERALALLPTGRAVSDDIRAARAGLAQLAVVVERLTAFAHLPPGARVTLDLGEVRGFEYYTGVRFQGFAEGVGDALLSGGRYDRLLGRYGRDAKAAGFAVDVERVALALPDEDAKRTGFYLAGPPADRARLAARLRRDRLRVCEDLDEPVPDEGLIHARAVAASAARLVVLDARGATLHDLDGDAARRRLSRAELAALLDTNTPLDGVLAPRYLAPPVRDPRGKP